MVADTIRLTQQRKLKVDRLNGTVHWQVNEFDHGDRIMLIAEAPGGISFHAHFDVDQWAEFQDLVAGVQS